MRARTAILAFFFGWLTGTHPLRAPAATTKFLAASARLEDPTASRLAVKFLRFSTVVDTCTITAVDVSEGLDLLLPPLLVKGFLRRLFIQYYIRDFNAVSLFLSVGSLATAFGVWWGAYHWYVSVHTAAPASTGTVMLAVLPIILGIQLLLQAVVLDIQNTPRPSQAPRPPDASGGIGASPKAAAHTSAPPSN